MKYKIADFVVEMNCSSKFMLKLLEDYQIFDDSPVEINLCYHEYEINQGNLAIFEYNYTLVKFVRAIVEKGAFCFHASALSVDGEAILFSADSGTGKSTHAYLWKKCMQEHEIVQLNDDKPIIRFVDGIPYAYGTPWSGKHCIHCNAKAPVKALVFLERGKKNKMVLMESKEIFETLFKQVIAVRNVQEMGGLLDMIDAFVKAITIYQLQCNRSEAAVRLVYETIWEGNKDED